MPLLPAAVAGVRCQAIARASVSALAASLPVLYVSLLHRPPAELAGDTAFWFLMSNCVIAAIVATSSSSSGDHAAGTLLSMSKDDDVDGEEVGISFSPSGGLLPPVAIGGDVAVPLAPAPVPQEDKPPAAAGVDVNGGGRVVQGEVASAVTSSHPVDHALPPLMEGEEEEEEGVVTNEPCIVKNSTVKVEEAQGEDDDEIVPLATIQEGAALAEPADQPEAWSRVARSTRSLPVPEEGAADGEWQAALYSRSPDGGLRRSATVGSKPAAEEESEYWQLSDEELNRRVEDFIARFNREMRRQIEQEAGV
ncbi:hypothetical protein HU200_044197 [Digitaria exilis]|uniref:Uncharacterized protein n=1 Tax=Digitaria exilis TaxID=1010633 RepID=A0A835B242_9POAL|nr:hypothetical protein HU200_044197 [Digitaria exilis]